MAYDVYTRPGAWTRRQANRRGLGVLAIGLGCTALGSVALVLTLGHRLGALASVTLLGLVLAGKPHADRYANRWLNWHSGATAEEAVGATLDRLRYEGWHLMHDVEWRHQGNIDHIASGPTGVYVIETKLNRYEDEDPGRVMRQACQVHDELDVFVTPVICLHTRKGNPRRRGKVWVVPHAKLLDWLRAQHNQTVDFERLARLADRL